MSKRRKRSRATLTGIAVLAALVTAYYRPEATFHFDGTVERLRLDLDSHAVSWALNGIPFYLSGAARQGPFEGSFVPPPRSTILIERLSTGTLRIECVARDVDFAHEFQSLPQESTSSSTPQNRIVFVLDNPKARAESGMSLTLPFSGRVTIGTGGTVNQDFPTPLLRSGHLRLMGHSLISSSIYDAGSVDLSMGDSLDFPGQEHSASGVVVVDERPAVAVTFGVVSHRASVRRFGAQGYDVTVSLPSRITGDRDIQAVWLAYGATLAALLFMFEEKKR
jgi:hypothetical protein